VARVNRTAPPDTERPGAEHWVPEHPTLATLRTAAHGCRGCELYRDATQVVMGSGSGRAALMLLGEQPGDREDREGEPFVGPAGGVLDRALAAAGIEPDSVYVTNVVKHFRWTPAPRGKRRLHQRPTRAHVVACRPWLMAELDLVRPRGVVLLGGTAGQALYGSKFRVGEARGRPLDWPADVAVEHPPEWVLATNHPSAILRADDGAAREQAFAGLVDDLRAAIRLLQ
jgi:uracil-DNA glycosylase family protein